ncbi:MAG: MgtC/SapB family protein [candidate division WS1 bacterium]|jgi:putative Mg2+ transporter-C (MgtC) family protein|nr:MgtC/SapB family protein [candidate division WS1 bacterium]
MVPEYAELPELQVLLMNIGIALVLGALIGYDRERKDKPAGLRTHALVSVAASLAMMGALVLDPGEGNDAIRGIGAIMTGIGFLGAGAILRRGEVVVGLKTGATIWTAGAVGMTVGLGWYGGAVATVVGILLILTLLGIVDEKLSTRTQKIRVMMSLDGSRPLAADLLNDLERLRFEIVSVEAAEVRDSGSTGLEMLLNSPAELAPEVAASMIKGREGISDVHFEVQD